MLEKPIQPPEAVDSPNSPENLESPRAERRHPYYQEIILPQSALAIFEKIAAGEYPNLAELQQNLHLGTDFDNYIRLLRDLAAGQKRAEYGAYLLSGTEPDNQGPVYAKTRLRRGTFGKATGLEIPSQSILERLGASVRGRAHTHPTDPPYFHFGDPWPHAYDSPGVSKRLHGGNLMYEVIATPTQAGILFVTQEGRDYIEHHRPIQFELIRSEIREEIRQIVNQMNWGKKHDTRTVLGLKNHLRRQLQTKWWGEIGMGILMAREIDAVQVVYQPIDASGSSQEFIERMSQKGLVSTHFQEHSGF